MSNAEGVPALVGLKMAEKRDPLLKLGVCCVTDWTKSVDLG